jgi:hypothetical protein
VRNAALAAVLLGLAGCGSIPTHRYRQYSNVTHEWDAATRERVLDERIQIGDTREMVYVALGMTLTPPKMTDDQPPRERWEYLVFETDPVFPDSAAGDKAPPLVSSEKQPSIRAVTMNNIVLPEIGGPPTRLLAVEFGPDNRVVAWELYPNSEGRFISPGFEEINLPNSPRKAAAGTEQNN